MHAVCGHTRPEGSARGCCFAKDSIELMRKFKIAARESGNFTRVQKSGCLDFCEAGPTCVVYPQGEWFKISNEAIPMLVDYLEGGSLQKISFRHQSSIVLHHKPDTSDCPVLFDEMSIWSITL